MISIKQLGDKWRLNIIEETWEYDTLKDLEKAISEILKNKNIYGRVNNE